MKSLLAFAILGTAMTICGIGEKQESGISNTATTKSNSAPSKPDKQVLTDELMKMESEIVAAVVDGDITLLAQWTTDDFELTDIDGKVQNKNQALADVKKETAIKEVKISDPELLSCSEDTAVLRYTELVKAKNGRSAKVRITDSFVKKDGKWLIKSEQQTLMK
jgi:hypothetical protein